MSDDDLVTIAILHDPIMAEAYQELLEKQGIRCLVPGSQHSATLGRVYGAFLEIPVKVPKGRATEARALLDAITQPEEAEEASGDEPPDTDDGPYRKSAVRRSAASNPRSTLVAAFCACVISFGTGHFYAREGTSGALLLLGELVAFGLLAAGFGGAGYGLVAVMLIDLVGGVRAARRATEGTPYTPGVQLTRTAPLVFLAVAVPTWLLSFPR